MLRLDGSKSVSPETPLSTAMELMARDSENPLLVISKGKPVGVLSREDAVTFLNTLKQLGLSNSATGPNAEAKADRF
jgi:predicted transcriptional regulator